VRTGKIKMYDEKRGFGFITIDGTKREDIFVHISEVTPKTEEGLKVGQRVSFETGDSDRGPRAVNVQILGEAV